ncbi:Maf family nucleotide pyrophosphatase [Pedobacter sp. MC2016-15]|uniref:Maf family protein n=1 Tax=Pedobacter sp. MC2016-15 TaxID=2994473 RepID=UPI0022477617|nr:Maf family nucleotide pyrophosphatase [Pedobacter sp. MC2016-15]MCX2479295.1 Maf family nucleotide pyrophosphatase [Pedobacter sp. MC2016-15]
MYKQTVPLILASKSPRRQELLQAMGLKFNVLFKDVEESYPEYLSPAEIACYIAEKKALAFSDEGQESLVITADTIVAYDGEIMGKPANADSARRMLGRLSGTVHQVYTGVSLVHKTRLQTFYDMTEVWFREITPEEIDHYINNYNPFDKAGSYGIQDWLGFIAVEKITGSYTNVMGLPTEKLYSALSNF